MVVTLNTPTKSDALNPLRNEKLRVLTAPSLVAETRRKEESLLGSCCKGPLVRREHGDHQWRQLTLNLLNVRERIKEKKSGYPLVPPREALISLEQEAIHPDSISPLSK